MAQTLHLDIPSASRLRKARAFLCEADLLVADVKSLLSDGANFAMIARLKDIEGRLADEVQAVEQLIAASKSAFRH